MHLVKVITLKMIRKKSRASICLHLLTLTIFECELKNILVHVIMFSKFSKIYFHIKHLNHEIDACLYLSINKSTIFFINYILKIHTIRITSE